MAEGSLGASTTKPKFSLNMGAVTGGGIGGDEDEKITGFGNVGSTPSNATSTAQRLGFTPSHAAGSRPMLGGLADNLSMMSKSPMNAGNL